ncbi:N-6 DNA methylase, partial [Hydrogenivirga sp. 128-5-R1-1]|uniref:N-6 DNA methylase n=1 Tax=Hydrogenivirga sp. 128-5-R1-1 TaxID=392423 RepID=UPI00015F1AB1
LFLSFLKSTILKGETKVEVEKSVSEDGVFIGRTDLSIGKVVFEFKKNIKSRPQKRKGLQELERYFHSDQFKDSQIGILTDGINFEVYKRNNLTKPIDSFSAPIEEPTKEKIKEFLIKLDRYILSSKKIDLTSENIVNIFGQGSVLFRQSVEKLKNSFEKLKEEEKEVSLYFNQWKSFMKYIYGENVISDEMFIRHTYLNILIKIISYNTLKKIFGIQARDFIQVLNGEYFENLSIYNYIEKDFFSWIFFDIETLNDVSTGLETVIEEKFSFENVSEDVLKEIYEDIVIQKERHEIGEYYTRDWLAEKVILDTVNEIDKKVLDPACGSGTFLFKTIHQKKKRLNLEDSQLLKHILNTVIGFDINPISIIIARTNYLIALGGLLKEREREIFIPVYNADSFRFPLEKKGASTGLFSKAVDIKIENKTLSFPIKEENLEITDELIEAVINWANRYYKEDFKRFLEKNYKDVYKQFSADLPLIEKTAKNLKEIIDKKGNGIWAYIIKNNFKPLFFKNKIDYIVGNPPWLTYKDLNKDYQKFIDQLFKYYDIKVSGHLKTHIEIATLFFIVSMELFLKENGKIGFVLPASIFTADHQTWFRVKTGFKDFSNKVEKIYDLRDVSPVFNIKSGVVISQKIKGYVETPKEISALKFKGKLKRKNLELFEAKKHLKIKETKVGLVILDEDKKYWITGAPFKDLRAYKSKYYRMFKQGATIVPRRFWFVEIEETGLGYAKDKIPVISIEDPQDKIKVPPLKGTVPEKYLYKTLLSKNLYPFGYCKLDNVVLPIEPKGNRFVLKTSKDDVPVNLKEWLEKAEKYWGKVKKGKLDIYENLNYRNKLTEQNPNAKYVCLYTSRGSNIASCFIENNGKFIVDHAINYAYMDGEDESYFITAILNSNLLNQAIKQFQSEGLYGERNIHKLPLLMPIPEFDPTNEKHLQIVELAKICKEKANYGKPFICGYDERKRRSIGRYEVDFELNQIDRILYDISELKIFVEEKPKELEGIALFFSEEIENLKEDIKNFLKEDLKKTLTNLKTENRKKIENLLTQNSKNIYPAQLTYKRYNYLPPEIFDGIKTAWDMLGQIEEFRGNIELLKDLIYLFSGISLGSLLKA